MNNEKEKADQAKSKIPENANRKVDETVSQKGKVNKAENKARSAKGKARSKNQGHEAVSDQKSHEYH